MLSWGVGLLGLAAAVAPTAAGELEAEVVPALGGAFRRGSTVVLRVTLTNNGPAVSGRLDLVVEGVVYRRPLAMGAEATATVDVAACVYSEASRARLVATTDGGEELLGRSVDLGLLGGAERPLVVAAAEARAAAVDLFGPGLTAVEQGELPHLAAAYAPVDALVLWADGSALSPAAGEAVGQWIRGGGLAVFLLPPEVPVRTTSLLADLGACAGRPSASAWLEAAREREGTWAVGEGVAWRLGLGHVVAGPAEGLAPRAVADLLPAGPEGYAWADRGVYESLAGPRWSKGARHALAWKALGLLAVATALGLVLPRRWGARRTLVCAAAGSGLLAAVAFAMVLPSGRAVVETAAVVECVGGGSEGRRTEVVGVSGWGRGHARLDLGQALAVVPFYHTAEDAGTWDDVVVACDETGRWSVELDIERHERYAFAAWWAWGSARGASGGFGKGDLVTRDWQAAVADGPGLPPPAAWVPVRSVQGWEKPQRELLAWQGRRAGRGGRLYRVELREDWQTEIEGRGVLEVRQRPALVWVDVTAGE